MRYDESGMPRNSFTFGSSPICDIVLYGPGVMPIHGRIYRDGTAKAYREGEAKAWPYEVMVQCLAGQLAIIRSIAGARMRFPVSVQGSLVIQRGDVVIVGLLDVPVV